MYKLVKKEEVVVCVLREDEDGTVWSIPTDPANSDYQAYLAWVAEGNEALASE